MSRIRLFIAASLDGFIAGPNDEIDWLFTDGDYGYKEFYDSIDTVIVGRKTYEICLTLEDEPFKGKNVYILTRKNDLKFDKNVKIWSDEVGNLITKINKESNKDIWLVGGGEITDLFLEKNLIDEIILFVHPIILHNGIQLFPNKNLNRVNLQLLKIDSFPNGLVQLNYNVC